MKDVNLLGGLKRFCMSIGEIPTSYLESMSYYEMLEWFCKFLSEKVIPTINNNGEALKELQTFYVKLKNYTENYFENLDVQEEIDNKIDKMIEEGTLDLDVYRYLDVNLCEYIFPKFIAGQLSGDFSLLRYNNKVIMIDTEKPETWLGVKETLDDNNISHIDYLIVSHYHSDHAGNVENLYNNGYIDNTTSFFMPAEVENYNVGADITRLKQFFGLHGLIWHVPNDNETLVIGKLKLTFTNNNKAFLDTYYITHGNGDYNNCSMVVLVEHENTKTLFMGDGHSEVQQVLYNNNFIKSTIDMYKIGHHGVDQITYMPFMNAIHPKIAIQLSGIGFFTMNELSLSGDVDYFNSIGCKVYSNFMQKNYMKFISNGYSIGCVSGNSSPNAMANETKTIYVDINASNQYIQDGTQEHPFKEVMQAVGLANTYNGLLTTINISSGTYGVSLNTQALTSSKNRITVAKNCNIIFNGTGSNRTDVVLNGVNLLNANVRFQNLTIDCKYHDGIYARNSEVELNNCLITTSDNTLSTHNGIYARNSRIFVESSRFDYCKPMIYVNYSSVVTTKSVVYGAHNDGFITNSRGIVYEIDVLFDNPSDKLTNFKHYGLYIKPVQIFYQQNADFSSESINLLAKHDDFRYIEITYIDSLGRYYSSGKICVIGSNWGTLHAMGSNGTNIIDSTVSYVISNKVLTYKLPANKTTNLSSGATTISTDRKIYIKRIVGYIEDEVFALN